MLAVAALLSLQDPSFSAPDFEKHVRVLASADMKGRDLGTAEGRKAAQYVAERLKELGLKPGGKDGWFQEFTSRGLEGRNVVGLLEGTVADEFVIVAAHHDGRGIVDGKVQPGADDNASGVAMVLELARSFKDSRPHRSILFISFDGEEKGLLGSREFVRSGLYAPSSIAAMFVFDLIGGDFFEWEKDRVYALGSEYSAELSDRVARAAAESRDCELVRTAVALIEPYPEMARSDYHAFRGKAVPFVFFSTGTPWYYHTEYDTVERVRFDKMSRVAGVIRKIIAGTAADLKRPVFRAPERVEEDARTVPALLDRVLRERDRLKLTPKQEEAAKAAAREIAEPGGVELKKLQQAMIVLFNIARSQGRP
jgi:hypothetical protein